MISMAHAQSRHSGLSHLVEAATALTKLEVLSPSLEEASADLQQGVVSDDDSPGKRPSKPATAASSREIFPQRLMAILSDPSVSDVISWLPNGKSFVIIRPDCLAERVLSKYFASTDPRSSTKYPSFTRKLNRWGFRQATRGPDTGAFHHPLFQRDQPDLCLDMVCQKSRKPKSCKPTERKGADASPSSLPPKKRKMPSAKKAPVTDQQPQLHHRVVSDDSLSANNSSSDDQSVSSASAAAPQAQRAVPVLSPLASLPVPLTAIAPAPVAAPAAPIVVNDAKLVAAALKAREEMERLSAARAMLFEAYVKALNGQ